MICETHTVFCFAFLHSQVWESLHLSVRMTKSPCRRASSASFSTARLTHLTQFQSVKSKRGIVFTTNPDHLLVLSQSRRLKKQRMVLFGGNRKGQRLRRVMKNPSSLSFKKLTPEGWNCRREMQADRTTTQVQRSQTTARRLTVHQLTCLKITAALLTLNQSHPHQGAAATCPRASTVRCVSEVLRRMIWTSSTGTSTSVSARPLKTQARAQDLMRSLIWIRWMIPAKVNPQRSRKRSWARCQTPPEEITRKTRPLCRMFLIPQRCWLTMQTEPPKILKQVAVKSTSSSAQYVNWAKTMTTWSCSTNTSTSAWIRRP